MTLPLLLVLAAYVAGSTPTSHWVASSIYGVDLRKQGSGNLGATNVYRVLGWKAAAPVVIVDIVKGWAPTALFPLAAPSAAPAWTLAYGAAAVLGHVFSFWVGFRGGKGVATSAGVSLALAPLATLIALAVWLVALLGTGYVSLGSVLAAVALPTAMALTPHRGGRATVGFAVALGLFVIWAHRGNLGRLLRGEERRFGRRGR
jgi:acyl phosphate:glycerol-3-phosphate acyltransferase